MTTTDNSRDLARFVYPLLGWEGRGGGLNYAVFGVRTYSTRLNNNRSVLACGIWLVLYLFIFIFLQRVGRRVPLLAVVFDEQNLFFVVFVLFSSGGCGETTEDSGFPFYVIRCVKVRHHVSRSSRLSFV